MNRLKKILPYIWKTIVAVFALAGVAATIFAVTVFGHPKELLTAASVYRLIQEGYYQEVDQARLVEGLAAGMAASLNDPYSVYYDKEAFEEFNSHMTGLYGGIGVLMGMDKETELVKAIKIFPGSPAEQEGIRPGDLFVEAGGKNAEGLGVDEVSALIRGEPGTQVEVLIARNGDLLPVTLTRETIKAPSVSGTYLDTSRNDYYIEISTFGDTTAQEMKTLLDGLERKPEGIILDLRSNGGGLVDQALKVAEYFVNGGVVLYETSRNSKDLTTFTVGNENFLDIPLVILVGENTASSAEILSGAVQDHGSGLLVGENTFGKALVQSIFPLPTGGALKLTTQRYLTPDKRDISKDGLKPDILISPDETGRDYTKSPDEQGDNQLRKALEVLQGLK